ncbi:MAG: thioredoxin family protein [Planctomycetota bacterium]|jgi:small redox-active disulfide protein 2
MQIEILGPGCVNCETLAANAKQAVEALGLEADVTKITDIAQITARGVVVTPALAVDGQVKSSGKVLTPAQIRELLV